jgi:hypothetical protein
MIHDTNRTVWYKSNNRRYEPRSCIGQSANQRNRCDTRIVSYRMIQQFSDNQWKIAIPVVVASSPRRRCFALLLPYLYETRNGLLPSAIANNLFRLPSSVLSSIFHSSQVCYLICYLFAFCCRMNFNLC